MRGHGQQVSAVFRLRQREAVFQGLGITQLHAVGNQLQVLFVVIRAYFIVQALAQLKEMLAGGAHAQQSAADRQQAIGFLPVERTEHAGQQRTAGIGQRNAGHAGDQPGDVPAALAGLAHGIAGDVQAVGLTVRQRRSQLAGVVALAAADIQPLAWRMAGGQLRQALGQRGVVTGL